VGMSCPAKKNTVWAELVEALPFDFGP